MNTKTTLPISKIAGKQAIWPVKTWAEAYAKASELFTISGIYYTGFGTTKEASEDGKVVYSIYPNDRPLAKIYFIF